MAAISYSWDCNTTATTYTSNVAYTTGGYVTYSGISSTADAHWLNYGTSSSYYESVTYTSNDIIWIHDYKDYGNDIIWIRDYKDYNNYSFEITRIDSIKAHHLSMQRKIEKAWDELIERYYRNDNHTKEMQKKINSEWNNYLRHLRYEEEKEKRELPEKKAQELLGLLIGEDQLEVYRKTGRVFVKGKKGEYMVKRGGGISKIEGKKIIDFCVHIESKYQCPPTDHAIALKMMLEEDDKKLVKIANRLSSREVSELPKAACM